MTTPTQLCPTCRLPIPADAETCPHDGTLLRLEATAVRDPLIGQPVGEYRIDERIGTGGMGIVYRATQPLIGKQVAIKILRPEIATDPEQMKRLLEEARAVSQIHHRGIIDIYGFGRLPDGRQYVVMEHLSGQTLEEAIARGDGVPLEEALHILDEILSALGAAHAAGVIHRDLKPSNIFLVHQSDGSLNVKVLDFGLAKRSDPASPSPQSRLSLMVGTPEFMAPEQARGERVGPATDLYAVGVIAFELFTGKLPFTGATPIEIVLQHMDKPAPAPSSIAPRVPPAIDAFVLSLLAKRPADRPPSAELVRQALRRITLPGMASLPPIFVTGPIPLPPKNPTPPSTGELARTFLAPRPRRWAVGSLGAGVIALLLVWAAHAQLDRLGPDRDGRAATSDSQAAVEQRSPERTGQPVAGSAAPAAPTADGSRAPERASASPAKAAPIAGGVASSEAAPRSAPASGGSTREGTRSGAAPAASGAPRTGVVATKAEHSRSPHGPVLSAALANRAAPRHSRRIRLAVPSRDALDAELARLESALAAQTPAGQSPDPLAEVVLQQARRDLARADSSAARLRVAQVLSDWEHQFIKRP